MSDSERKIREVTPEKFRAGYVVMMGPLREPIRCEFRMLTRLPNGNYIVRWPEIEIGKGAEIAEVDGL